MKSISGFSGVGANFGVAGRREAAADGAGSTKTRRESRLMSSPPFPRSQASLSPLSKKDGGAICYPYFELFTRGEVAPLKDSTPIEKNDAFSAQSETLSA
jgi:hypothetical protein